MKRVVVTGLGLITSIGTGYDESWNSLLQGKSGIKIIDHFDTEDLSCKIAGHLISSYEPSNHLETNILIVQHNIFLVFPQELLLQLGLYQLT